MPDVQEVFRMATQKVRPDPGALERQQIKQRRRTTRRRVGGYAVAAALVGVLGIVAARVAFDSPGDVDIGTHPSSPSTATQPVATVTSDGETCSIDITAPDAIEHGYVRFVAVNDTDERAVFDSWELAEGYSFEAFERAVQRDVRLAEQGEGAWPGDGKITYISSEVIPAQSSGIIVVPMSAGTHAVTCLKPFEGQGLRPYGIAGPITVR